MASAIRDYLLNKDVDMIISNAVEVQAGLAKSPQPNALVSQMTSIKSSAQIAPELPMTKVSISGQALMKQRVFDGAEPRHRPLSVADTSASLFMNANDFLTRQDCQVLSDVYAFAQESGADLRFADNLASSLADYRSFNNGQRIGRHNDGTTLDSEGHMVFYSFLDKDVVTTQRILASEALKTTQLDQGFIRYTTNADCSAIYNNQFEFLEQVINKFSAKGDEVPPLDARFSQYGVPEKRFNMRLSKEVYEFGPKGRVPKGTAAANANDPSALPGKTKKNVFKTKPTAPETVQDMFRRVMAKAFGSGWGIRIRSLAEFLMRSGR